MFAQICVRVLTSSITALGQGKPEGVHYERPKLRPGRPYLGEIRNLCSAMGPDLPELSRKFFEDL